MTATPAFAGGCFCGRVRYEIRGLPFNPTLCHCRDCRRVTGAPAVAWLTCRPGDFVLAAGEPRRLVSSANVVRGFCGDCGTALTYARADLPDEIDVTIASLDRPDELPPCDNTQYRHRLGWMDTIARLPAFPDGRADGPAARVFRGLGLSRGDRRP